MTRDTNLFARTSGTRAVPVIAGTFGVAVASGDGGMRRSRSAGPLGADAGGTSGPGRRADRRQLRAHAAHARAPGRRQRRDRVAGRVHHEWNRSDRAGAGGGAVSDPYRQLRMQPAVYERGDDLGEARVIPVVAAGDGGASGPDPAGRIPGRASAQDAHGEEERDHHRLVGRRRRRRWGGHRRQEGRAHRCRDRRRRGGALGPTHAARSLARGASAMTGQGARCFLPRSIGRAPKRQFRRVVTKLNVFVPQKR